MAAATTTSSDLLNVSGAFNRAAITRRAWDIYRSSRLMKDGFCKFRWAKFMRYAWEEAKAARVALHTPAPVVVPVVLTETEKRGIAYWEDQIASVRQSMEYCEAAQRGHYEGQLRNFETQIIYAKRAAQARCEREAAMQVAA